MKTILKTFAILILTIFSINYSYSQEVIAAGQEPAWILDYDNSFTFNLFVGENQTVYTLIKKSVPESSTADISVSYSLKSLDGKTATLVIEYFDPESPESCPCFHDMGEGKNAGKAYLITEKQTFYIGCAEFTGNEVLSAMD